ncbi:hypothetical protein QE152_g10678 [Popillia japonica]|uniref:Uncharacterized protein n=1 Tax=Popillia japonica TaxID=7064 RepID=A0AAW1LTX1_POPJA
MLHQSGANSIDFDAYTSADNNVVHEDINVEISIDIGGISQRGEEMMDNDEESRIKAYKDALSILDNIKEQALVNGFRLLEEGKWLSLIGRSALLAKGMEHVRKTYRICGMQFSEDAKFESYHNRSCLKVDCVPSQYLPRLDESILGTEEVNNLPATSTQGIDSVEGSAELILPASPIPGPSTLEVPAEKIKISKRKNLTTGH